MKKILIILLLTFATNWVQTGEKRYMDTDTIEPYVNEYGRVAVGCVV